jgi:surfeit locus 1 family protein
VIARVLPAALALLGIALLLALGAWQLERRSWKLQLIARVNARVHAPVVAAPGPDRWSTISSASDEYRHVSVTGHYMADRQTRVHALTVLGAGYWALTPLQTDQGLTVLVNRGFVPADPHTLSAYTLAPAGTVTITGLLRLSEPRGTFLRHNVPGEERWYSRDVAAIAHARGLSIVAPYFIDADAGLAPSGYPVGGLTVITFPNNHLLYALTWFSLALLGSVTLAIGRRHPPSHATA